MSNSVRPPPPPPPSGPHSAEDELETALIVIGVVIALSVMALAVLLVWRPWMSTPSDSTRSESAASRAAARKVPVEATIIGEEVAEPPAPAPADMTEKPAAAQCSSTAESELTAQTSPKKVMFRGHVSVIGEGDDGAGIK